MKLGILGLALLFSSSLLQADYQFNNFEFALSNITDSSLPEDIQGKSLSTSLSGELSHAFVLSGGVSVTAYDEKTIDGIFVDFASHGFNFNIAKYYEYKNNNKLFAYIGSEIINVEAAFDTTKIKDSDTAITYGAGIIAPINSQIDLLLNVDVSTLFNETDQGISIGLSFDLDKIAAIEASLTQQDEVDAASIAIRLNYE